MQKPWQPEREVSAELARELIAEQFPELAVTHLEAMPAGWDNTVFVATGPFPATVFRFPRRKVAVELLENESRVLTALTGEMLNLAIPSPELIGQATEAFPWPFIGYPLLDGTTADRARLTASERRAFAAPLATFLVALHAIDGRRAREIGAPPDNFGRGNVARARPLIEERVAHLRDRGLGGDLSSLAGIAQMAQPGLSSCTVSLCHGDLYARHVLVDSARLPCAVIDWGDVHHGPSALDLSIAFTFLPPPALTEFFDLYGDISSAERALALSRAVLSAVSITAYGDDTKDDALVTEGLVAIDNVRAAIEPRAG